MEERQPNKIQKLIHSLKDRYHLSVVNKELFVEVFSMNISRGRLILVVLGLVISVSATTFFTIYFTGLKKYIPGFESKEMQLQLIEQNKRLIEAEKKLALKKKYAEVLDTILNDFGIDPESLDSLPHDSTYTDNRKASSSNDFLPEHYLNLSEISSKSLYNYHFFKPINGLVSKPYNSKEKHYGIDVVAKKNEPVKSTLGGKVILSSWTAENGHIIAIQHSNNILSIYKHNAVLLKKEGDFVKAGEVIAIVGNSGEFTTGPHLHFEIWHEGAPLNPSEVIVFE